jgi:hypothetical protein
MDDYHDCRTTACFPMIRDTAYLSIVSLGSSCKCGVLGEKVMGMDGHRLEGAVAGHVRQMG